MTIQLSDMIYLPFKNKKYSMLACENEWLIDVGNFNIKPVLDGMLSCNWKGYESEYILEDNKYLYWNLLKFRAKNGQFPAINGVEAELRVNEFDLDGKQVKIYFREYKDIMIVPYTGGIILGDCFIRNIGENSGYQYPHSYKEVLECRFKCGELVDISDHSLKMERVRQRLGKNFILEKISRRFLFDNYYSLSYKDKWDVYKRL